MGDKGTRKYAIQVKRQSPEIGPNLAESKVEHAAYVYACRLVHISPCPYDPLKLLPGEKAGVAGCILARWAVLN